MNKNATNRLIQIALKRLLDHHLPLLGVRLAKRVFSLYDIEQFLKDEGAERVNENAVATLAKELEDTVKELVSEAQVYANYAGRTKVIRRSDVAFASKSNRHSAGKRAVLNHSPAKRTARRKLSNYEVYRGFPLPVTAKRMP